MPMYTYMNEETGEKIDRIFKIKDKPQSVIENGIEYKYVISMPAIVSGVGGLVVPSNLKERLTQIKKFAPEMRSSVV